MRQQSHHYSIDAGPHLTAKEFRYLRILIVKTAIHQRFIKIRLLAQHKIPTYTHGIGQDSVVELETSTGIGWCSGATKRGPTYFVLDGREVEAEFTSDGTTRSDGWQTNSLVLKEESESSTLSNG